MKCYHPIPAYRTADGSVHFVERSRNGNYVNEFKIPCGQCIGCRERRASDWAARVMHEASGHERTCFVTLTYGRDQLPEGASLCYADFQRFMKRVRKKCGPVRFYMCGEYGPETQRPHYHACLFGVDFLEGRKPRGKSGSGSMFYESDELTKLWSHGIATVQDLVPQTAMYCAMYIMKKRLGPGSDEYYGDREPEMARMSLKPGIGAAWYEKFGRSDAHTHNFVVVAGVRRRVPKYYDKLLDRGVDEKLKDRVDAERAVSYDSVRALENLPDRLRVQEEVHVARIRNKQRGNV